jgi:hypothetical protein
MRRNCPTAGRPEETSNFERRIGELREASVIPTSGRLCQQFFGRIGQSPPARLFLASFVAQRGLDVRRSNSRTKQTKAAPRIKIRGAAEKSGTGDAVPVRTVQTSCSFRTGSRVPTTPKAHSASADLAAARGSRPSSLPAGPEPGSEQEPAREPEPCSGPGSEQRQEPHSPHPTHSRRRSQPGHSSSVCSSHRQLRNRTDGEPFPHDGGPSDRSRPRRRSVPPQLPCCSSKDCGGGFGRFPWPPRGGHVRRRH